jgi:D-beta-D-heptose 7-phosphate kinase/D-beta-D-heptose 1-phosphate adenosyltransferase
MAKPNIAKIFTDVNELNEYLHFDKGWNGEKRYITMVSGGFSILHFGHVEYIQEAANIKFDPHEPLLVVIVNGDGWLERKKGYVIVPEMERARIIAGISGVDAVLIWDDGTSTVCGAIEVIIPDWFAKGGDRDSQENVPEYATCESIGCEVVFGVGGEKTQSSSLLEEKASKHMN